MDKELLRKGLQLYYNILKLHRKKLAGPMRRMGDLYVKQEFQQHHTNPNPHYYTKFYEGWTNYYEHLNNEGLKGVSKPMDPESTKLLNNDQK